MALATLVIGIAAACGGDGTGPSGGGAFGDIGGLLGGFNGSGFSAFGQKLDSQFVYLYFNTAVAEGPWNCYADGYCGVAGMRKTFGALVETDSFMVVSTANFKDTSSLGVERAPVVRNSGVQTHPITIKNPAQYTSVRASFEFAFASARSNTAAHNDSIIVRLKAGTDSVVLFKVTYADLTSGRFPTRNGGCGSATIIVGRAISYPICTGWVSTTVDLTAYKGRTFALQFIAAEGGQSASDTVDEPIAFLFRKTVIEGAK